MSPVGRPKADDPKLSRFSVRLDLKTEKELEEYCQQKNISKGEAIRQGIYLLLRQNKKQ